MTHLLLIVTGFIVICFTPAVAYSMETVILTVSLNTIPHGEFFLKRNKEGVLLMRSEDLVRIGFKKSVVPITVIDNESYTAINLPGVSATLDELHLSLDLRAGADLVDLPIVVQNFSPPSASYTPSSENSAFINYQAHYGNSIDTSGATWSATGQSGLRRGNLLLLGDGFYQRTQNSQQAVRLMTDLFWDRPATTSKWVAGDINATAGEPGGPVIIGGIGYASSFSLNPELTTYPRGEFGGVATLPSEASIYVNGILVSHEQLAPGQYRFRNLPVWNGANNVEIVMRDSFGNENRTTNRFYLSDHLLKAGLHDYSYNLGFLRQDFGSASNHYGRPLLVARHSVGLNDSFTIGSGVEVGNDLVNVIPKVVLSLSQLGIVSLLGAGSHDPDHGFGTTAGVGYQFQSRQINYQLSLSHSSRGYRTLANQQAVDTVRLNGSSGISMGTPFFGSVSLNGSFSGSYAGEVYRSLGATYSRSLAKKVQFSASVSNSWGSSPSLSFFAGLTFFPTGTLTVSATLETSQGSEKETLSLQKSLPAGDGIGFQASVDREHSADKTVLTANQFLQLNAPRGVYNAELQGRIDQQTGNASGNYLISAAGAVVYAGGHVGLSRPVTNSFAVVQVQGLANVKVLLDNQEVARSNADGLAYISNLQPYQRNKISFVDEQLDANYLIRSYTALATPGQFGGVCVSFPTARVQSYGGYVLEDDGTALEYSKVTLRGMELEFSFTTLKGGEFYFENIADTSPSSDKQQWQCGAPSPYHLAVVPGRYLATVSADGSERQFEVQIPVSEDMFVSLGRIFVASDPDKQ